MKLRVKMIDPVYDEDFDYPHLDPPELNSGLKPAHIKYIGEDKALIERRSERELHWSEREKLGYVPPEREEWPLGDKMADASDDQGWDIEDNLEEE